MKPIIGSRYTGVPFDRPCIRQLPSDWHLHIDEPETHWGDVVVIVLAVVIAVLFAAGVVVQIS